MKLICAHYCKLFQNTTCNSAAVRQMLECSKLLCVSVSILRGKILVKTDFLRYKFGLTVTVSLVRSRGLRNQIELI